METIDYSLLPVVENLDKARIAIISHPAAIYPVRRNFIVKNIGVLEKDDLDRPFYEIDLCRNTDIIDQLASDVEFEIRLNDESVGVPKTLYMTMLMYAVLRVRFFLSEEKDTFFLEHRCIYANPEIHRKLLSNAREMITIDGIEYMHGTGLPAGIDKV